MVGLSIWVFTPFFILAGLLVLFGLLALLGRIRGGRYLRAILTPLYKIPFMRRMLMRMQTAALERQNPELASAVRKMERFGTPTNPQQAQRALNMLTPGERKAYIDAAGEQGAMPEPTNRSERRRMEKVVPQGRPGAAGRRGGKGKRKR